MKLLVETESGEQVMLADFDKKTDRFTTHPTISTAQRVVIRGILIAQAERLEITSTTAVKTNVPIKAESKGPQLAPGQTLEEFCDAYQEFA